MKRIQSNDGNLPSGYMGKIARINLSESTVEVIPTSKYVPEYVGGRAVCNRIFWDDVKTGVGAFDPGNEIIMMTGATAGTGLPNAGRLTLTGVSPNSLPEQYTHSNMGGQFATMLKWAGWDGIVISGKAPRHTYVVIENDKISFCDADADGLWGTYVHDAQDRIAQLHPGMTSIVAGPAGENLHRNATLTNGGDSASAKAGFGAVFGAKNLKAVGVLGTGTIKPAHLDKVMELRRTVGNPVRKPNPFVESHPFASADIHAAAVEDTATSALITARQDCCQGCNVHCMNTVFFNDDPLRPGEQITQVAKCIDLLAGNYEYDIPWNNWRNVYSRHELTRENYQYNQLPPEPAGGSPDRAITSQTYKGDVMGLFGPSNERYTVVNVLCNEYGLDKWDVIVWYLSWLSMCQREGLLEGMDLGMPVDLDDMGFISHFIKMMVYRDGPCIELADGTSRPAGDVFAEGMARAIRLLGKDRYGDAPYHGRFNRDTGKPLALPVSLEAGWGHCSHYQGRGFENTRKFNWLAYDLTCMADSRDSVCSQHMHDWVENYREYVDDPCHSRRFVRSVIENDMTGELKESLVACEWRSPNIAWPEMEAEIYVAATGLDDVTKADLNDVAEASKLLYRAILMRDYGRIRDVEVETMYPFMTYPDPWDQTCTWDEWNDLVDLYYAERGWDRATGWPFRSTWEKYNLGYVADELEALGMLPPEGGTPRDTLNKSS